VAQKFHDLYTSTRFETLNVQPAAAANARAGKEMMSDTVANVRKYAAAVSAFDTEVGTVVQKLSERRLLDHTLIVLTSTCGALLGRHGLWGAGDASDPVNMYDEVMRTPLIWVWAGKVPAQGIRPEMVSTYDFAPSLYDLLGAAAPSANLCGRSYVPLVTGVPLPKKQPWKTTIFGHYQGTEMARIDRYKLVAHGPAKGELYDTRLDPIERVNQYDNQQFLTIRTSLGESLASWKQRYSA
jgi:arylsulfatase A-like enzyme